MQRFPIKLGKSLEKRKQTGSFRELKKSEGFTDLSSNDYLGFAGDELISQKAGEMLEAYDLKKNGATGSRLLSGNHLLYDLAENFLTEFHQTQSALIFNSGYDANVGLFSSVPARGDLIFYDEYIHASIRDGIAMSKAKAFKFAHNDLNDLRAKVDRLVNSGAGEVYIVTESVFSMDGDMPNLKEWVHYSDLNGFYLIVDEAHACGILGEKGEGLVQQLGLQEKVFARLVTFGKALGAHGAAILGSQTLKDYLVNYARSFIYTTALPPHAIATVLAAYQNLEEGYTVRYGDMSAISKLQDNISFFRREVLRKGLITHFISSHSAIQSCVVPGNIRVKEISRELAAKGFDVKPILSPTVGEGMERLRFCIHSYNSRDELKEVLKNLAALLKKGEPENLLKK